MRPSADADVGVAAESSLFVSVTLSAKHRLSLRRTSKSMLRVSIFTWSAVREAAMACSTSCRVGVVVGNSVTVDCMSSAISLDSCGREGPPCSPPLFLVAFPICLCMRE
ncbi:hypothetical protein NDU88_007471 [Pleurodeles waltl]|uniref:Uncharacterized protein n=1 Tax=Pleurodeles waltl TaxID=8319 RepID=A0AAV7RV63_PLEWA|nr:hypothetical protein NDU88_007471 [Pleurodeles waltl]